MRDGLAIAFSLVVASCDEPRDANASAHIAAHPELEATSQPTEPGWGASLLAVVPSRDDRSLPTTAELAKALGPCTAESRPCDRSLDGAAGPITTVDLRMDTSGDLVRTITLTACCSEEQDFFRPFERLPVIRTALICPELTIAASDPMEAFRVSAGGRRDFVFTRATLRIARGRAVVVTVHFLEILPGEECDVLAPGDEAAGTPTFQ